MELFWTILNTVLFILFIIVCFKAAIIIRKELGFWSFLFLVACLLSLAINKNDDNREEKLFNFQNRIGVQKPDSIGKFILTEDVLSNSVLSKISLRVKFENRGDSLSIVSGQVYRTGFLMVRNGSAVVLISFQVKEVVTIIR